jgi:hypothetical protein
MFCRASYPKTGFHFSVKRSRADSSRAPPVRVELWIAGRILCYGDAQYGGDEDMRTRRAVVGSLAGAFVLIGCGAVARAEEDGIPSAKVTPGTPPILDFGDGVKVPCGKGAFFTLWEGGTFWLTFGFGISPSKETAKSLAAKQAAGVMKFMLLTLAFAPERLVKGDDNGWRKRDPGAHDFVLGELELPSQPGKPMDDAFLGGGNIEISPFWNWSNSGDSFSSFAQAGAPPVSTSSGPPTDLRQAARHAFSSNIVLKKNLSLDDVRKRAAILQR